MEARGVNYKRSEKKPLKKAFNFENVPNTSEYEQQNTGMNPEEAKEKTFNPDKTEMTDTVTSSESEKDVSDNTGMNPEEAKEKPFNPDETEMTDTVTSSESEKDVIDEKEQNPKLSARGASAVPEDEILPDRPQYKATTVTEPATITFGTGGCKFFSEYIKLNIPRGAVEETIQIKITPHHKHEIKLDGKILITPVVEFQSEHELKFFKDVDVSIYTPYLAAEHGKDIEVEILREKHNDKKLQLIDKVKLVQKCWIAFKIRQMCRLMVAAPESDVENMDKKLCISAIVVETAPEEKAISWLVCDDTPDVKNKPENQRYFATQHRRMVLTPQTFTLGYNYGLRLQLESGENVLMISGEAINSDSVVEILHNQKKIYQDKTRGNKFEMTCIMLVAKKELHAEAKFALPLKFRADAVPFNLATVFTEALGYDEESVINKVNKNCFLDWENMPQPAAEPHPIAQAQPAPQPIAPVQPVPTHSKTVTDKNNRVILIKKTR